MPEIRVSCTNLWTISEDVDIFRCIGPKQRTFRRRRSSIHGAKGQSEQ